MIDDALMATTGEAERQMARLSVADRLRFLRRLEEWAVNEHESLDDEIGNEAVTQTQPPPELHRG